MCMAVPGKVLEVWGHDDTRMARVDVAGAPKTVCAEFVPDLEPGDYTVVHLGFALRRIDETSALETLALLRELGELEEDAS
jgi:hydrogenase expression/formation protein HypC